MTHDLETGNLKATDAFCEDDHLTTPLAPAEHPSGAELTPKPLVVRAYPKAVFLYPSWLTAFGCAIWQQAVDATPAVPGVHALIFSIIFSLNLSILAFEYSRLASGIIASLLSVFGLLVAAEPWLGEELRAVLEPTLFANAAFYWYWTGALTGVMVLVMLHVTLNFYELKDGELRHRRTWFRVVDRWPLANLDLEVEMNDVLEYGLFRSGRLVLRSASSRVLIISNVPGVYKVEDKIRTRIRMAKLQWEAAPQSFVP